MTRDMMNDLIRTDIHEAIARAADKTGVHLIDLYAFTRDHPEWFGDTIHGNARGNEAIAQYIWEQISASVQ